MDERQKSKRPNTLNKYLIAHPSPRDIPEVQECIDSWLHDIIVVKYEQQKKAYRLIKNYFMKHLQYTHLVIIPDDLVVSSEQLEELISIVNDNDFPVLSGVCAVDEDDTRDFTPMAMSDKVCPDIQNRVWLNLTDLDNRPNVLQVEYVGSPCIILKRYVVETVSWRGATILNKTMEGNYDWQLANDCKELHIPVYACKTVHLTHLRNRQKKEAKANPKCKKGFTRVKVNGSWNK